MKKIIRIGTRSSELALWQAKLVEDKLKALHQKSFIVEISSTGDEIPDKPLHQIGGFGLFTKSLDEALLQNKIDIAVHSLKDVPTSQPEGIVQAAVLERGDVRDVLVFNKSVDHIKPGKSVVATGSLRRNAQWLQKYPGHTIHDLRGNVNTRLRKLWDSNWDGAIFAAAGLTRINLLPENHLLLDWMLPAPAQGAVMLASRADAADILYVCGKINCEKTAMAVHIERQFMKVLEGGCTAPIGALAEISGDAITFNGLLIGLDGREKIEVSKKVSLGNWQELGKICALEILESGGKNLMKKIKSQMSK
jgi:hydroxymethylbilane synthase